MGWPDLLEQKVGGPLIVFGRRKYVAKRPKKRSLERASTLVEAARSIHGNAAHQD
jgi:hypothetical protein